jgi:hypothetical protein
MPLSTSRSTRAVPVSLAASTSVILMLRTILAAKKKAPPSPRERIRKAQARHQYSPYCPSSLADDNFSRPVSLKVVVAKAGKGFVIDGLGLSAA